MLTQSILNLYGSNSNNNREGLQPELRDMNEKSLEEELQALLSDKTGEAEYVQSLQRQIMTLKVSLLFLYVVIQIKQTVS